MKKKEEHRKYFNKEGNIVPSVTQIISLLNKPELVDWANYMGFKRINVKKFVNEKAIYGTEVHRIFESYFTNPNRSLFDIEEKFFDDDTIADYIEKFQYIKNILDFKKFKVDGSEIPMEGNRFGGTLDMLVSNEKYKIILDLKTSKDIRESMLIQLAGYCLLMKEVYNVDITHVGIILIEKEITDKKFLSIIKTEDNVKYKEVFEKLLDIYYILNN